MRPIICECFFLPIKTLILQRENHFFDEYGEKTVETLCDLKWRQIGKNQFSVLYSQKTPRNSDSLLDDCRKERFEKQLL